MEIQPYNTESGSVVGVTTGEPNMVYHANRAVSHSKLWTFHHRPKHFEGMYLTGEMEKPETPALRFGQAFHTIVLEGQRQFDHDFAVCPNLSFKSKADKAEAVESLNQLLFNPLLPSALESLASAKRDEIEKFFAALPGRAVLSQGDYDLVMKLALAIRENPIATDLLSKGYAETVFRSKHSERFGFAVQCRTDWMNPDGCETSGGEPYMVDVKTIDNLGRWDLEFRKRGYYRAWPFYNKVMEATVGEAVVKRCYWIVVEKAWPHAVRVYTPDETCWERGMAEIEADILSLSDRLKRKDFEDPGADSVLVQGLPDWLLRGDVTPGIAAILEETPALEG